MIPFIVYGKIIADSDFYRSYDLICFFPTNTIGGAEKINNDIVSAFPEKRILIYFTKKGKGQQLNFLDGLKKNITIVDISENSDNKFRYWNSFIQRGACAFLINNQNQPPVVFIGQCNFGYKVLPHLKKKVKVIDLIHVSDYRFALVNFPFISLIEKRISVCRSVAESYKQYYKRIGVPGSYHKRWNVIVNSIPFLFDFIPDRKYEPKLKIYYAGRGGLQKRLWLFFEVVRQTQSLQIEWHIVGPVESEIPNDLLGIITWHGIITNQEEMYALHRKMDIILLTSEFEGFPLVIMEAMANGVVPIATAVDALPEHISPGSTGYLLNNPFNEIGVVKQAVDLISSLSRNPTEIKSISKQCYNYSKIHFTRERFDREYGEVLFDKF